MKVNGRPPSSGDDLVDSVFKIIVETLKVRIKAIYLKTDLRFPDKKRQQLHGLSILDDDIIYLDNPKNPKERARLPLTLIHEVLHIAMPRISCTRITNLELALWARRTGIDEHQRKYLKTYIPKHEVKHEPNLEKPKEKNNRQKKKVNGQ